MENQQLRCKRLSVLDGPHAASTAIHTDCSLRVRAIAILRTRPSYIESKKSSIDTGISDKNSSDS